MRYPADDASSHEYEVKRVHMDGATFDAVVFYLRTGEPVNINVEDVLRKTDLWTEPGESCPRKEHHLIFEVAPSDDREPVELYTDRVGAVEPMSTTTIALDDATDLAHRDWLASLSGRPIPVSVLNINLADARDTSRLLGRPREATKDLHGFRPIPAGGRSVTNELVNELREGLGF